MKTLLNVAIILFVLAASAWTFSAKSAGAQMWEYKVDTKCTEKSLNELGAEGWEVAGVQQVSGRLINSSMCIMKRPK